MGIEGANKPQIDSNSKQSWFKLIPCLWLPNWFKLTTARLVVIAMLSVDDVGYPLVMGPRIHWSGWSSMKHHHPWSIMNHWFVHWCNHWFMIEVVEPYWYWLNKTYWFKSSWTISYRALYTNIVQPFSTFYQWFGHGFAVSCWSWLSTSIVWFLSWPMICKWSFLKVGEPPNHQILFILSN